MQHKKRGSIRIKKKKENVYIYGIHALEEALLGAPQVVKKVHLAATLRDPRLRADLATRNIPVVQLKVGQGNQLAGRDAVHQGVIALIDPASLLVSFDDFLSRIEPEKNAALAVLAEMHDPHNVGAIIRSAAAFGFAGILIPEHNQAGITGTVVKSSAGMVFRIPLVSIGNINATLLKLKERGFWIYGLATQGNTTLGTEAFDAPSAFVIGNEGDGIREKTLEHCDATISIPMHQRTESLNAAVSAGIVFSEWSRKHPESLT